MSVCRFSRIYRDAQACGEHTRVVQGLHENFLSMKFKDPFMRGVSYPNPTQILIGLLFTLSHIHVLMWYIFGWKPSCVRMILVTLSLVVNKVFFNQQVTIQWYTPRYFPGANGHRVALLCRYDEQENHDSAAFPAKQLFTLSSRCVSSKVLSSLCPKDYLPSQTVRGEWNVSELPFQVLGSIIVIVSLSTPMEFLKINRRYSTPPAQCYLSTW